MSGLTLNSVALNSVLLGNLIASMLEKDPEKRPTAKEVLVVLDKIMGIPDLIEEICEEEPNAECIPEKNDEVYVVSSDGDWFHAAGDL